MQLFSLPGPHDTPFAAPLMAGALLAFTLGFVILKLLDRVIQKRDP
jgi:prepilin signal peptidase PulO-like enzyme (type II secretory pathway)